MEFWSAEALAKYVVPWIRVEPPSSRKYLSRTGISTEDIFYNYMALKSSQIEQYIDFFYKISLWKIKF
jgi:hypothetical protein